MLFLFNLRGFTLNAFLKIALKFIDIFFNKLLIFFFCLNFNKILLNFIFNRIYVLFIQLILLTYLRNRLLISVIFSIVGITKNKFLYFYLRNRFLIIDLFLMLILQINLWLNFSLIKPLFHPLKSFPRIMTWNIILTYLLSYPYFFIKLFLFKI